MTDLPFLHGYPRHVLALVRQSLVAGTLGPYLAQRYPEQHAIRSDALLYEHAMDFKQRFMRHSGPLSKVVFDNRLQSDRRALGTLTTVSRVQGGQLRAKREVRIAAVFRQAPAAMLNMILVHELAHLKEREHGKAFYALCSHMLAGYLQVEFDTRLYLSLQATLQLKAVAAMPI
ncbi:M48 family metallopeptidase [Nostoc sp. HG1]|nr:M48 family metallopeptidase [Nostoc sp. HG1]